MEQILRSLKRLRLQERGKSKETRQEEKNVCGKKDPKVSAFERVRENKNEFLSVTSNNMLRCDACSETLRPISYIVLSPRRIEIIEFGATIARCLNKALVNEEKHCRQAHRLGKNITNKLLRCYYVTNY